MNSCDRFCPECQRTMKYDSGTGHHIDFSGTAEDWELEYFWEEWKCTRCGIEHNGNRWIIPEHLKPTEKQIKTVLFINSRLQMGLEALTKHQCRRDIGKYFGTAKKVPTWSVW